MAVVVDYSFSRPSYAALKAYGAVAVCRYLAYLPNSKCLSRSEAAGLRANGIDVVSNWEQAGSWAEYSGGRSTGRTHATEAQRQHLSCGGPPARPIYFSSDWDVTPAQLPTVAEYYRGVAEVIGVGRTGAYGGYRTIKYLFDQGVIAWGWQTYAWSTFRDTPSGPSYLHWDARAELRQVQNGVKVGGADVDRNLSQTEDFGQWGFTPRLEADDMTPEERALLVQMHGWTATIVEILTAIAENKDRTWSQPVKLVTNMTELSAGMKELLERGPAEFTDEQAATLAAAIATNQGLSPQDKKDMLEIVKRAAREGSVEGAG